MNITRSVKYFLRRPFQLPIVLLSKLPYFRFIRDTEDYRYRITFEAWFIQKVLNMGGNREAYWPVHYTSKVYDAERIRIGVDTFPGITGGCYITGIGGLTIGDHTMIAPNAVIVTANHDPHDLRKRLPEPVSIGSYCWLGAGAKIMPGVTLGDFTIVGAGAVVTRSFPDGHCIIGGVPAGLIKTLDRAKCVRFGTKKRYHGYLNEEEYAKFVKKSSAYTGKETGLSREK